MKKGKARYHAINEYDVRFSLERATLRVWLVRVLGPLVAMAALLVVGGYLALRSSLPDYEGDVQVKGLLAPVQLIRDENAIPHIFARSKTDGYFGLGYVHAQDRLWQLEITRRVANGRLAEAVGPDGIPTDILVAVFDIESIARKTEARYSPFVRNSIVAYVAGINAAIAHHRGPWPPEFSVVGLEPQPWTARDVSRAGAMVALGFGDLRDELFRARLLPRIGCAALRSLYASEADPGPVSYPDSHLPGHAPNDSCGVLPLRSGSARTAAMLPFGRSMPASNGWAVAGQKTRSGLPLLANDPHGPLTAPADYYLARMSGPGFEIVGASRPGAPGFASGHNGRIAWGVTDMMIDQADIAVERLVKAKQAEAYLRGGKAIPFSERIVSIPVKGEQTRALKIRSTHEGPVLSDHDADAARLVREQLPKGHVAVLRGMDFPDGLPIIEALVGMADAQDLDSFRKAASHFRFQQNFVFADREGPIALLAAAHLPTRRGDGFLPVPGWEPRFGGGGAIPHWLLPISINPRGGFVMNANNRAIAGRGRLDSVSFEPGWRALRISRSLAMPKPLGLSEMKALQLDVRSAEVEALKPFLVTIKPISPRSRQALALLTAWDGVMSPDRAEPLIWNAWVRKFSMDLLRPKMGYLTETYLATQRPRLARLLTGEGGWCDSSKCPEIASKSLDAAIEALTRSQGPMSDWKWGSLHTASFKHDIFSSLPLIGTLLVSAPATGGDAMTVNSGQTSLWGEQSFLHDYGPRYRQIIDLSSPRDSLFMIVPGVSGHPASPWFDHFVPSWAAGHYVKVSGDPSAVAKRGVGRLMLRPTSAP